MKMQLAVAGVLAFTVSPVGTATALAQPSPQALAKVAEMMTEADLNADGKTSRNEYNQHRAQMFARLDRNSNGVIERGDRPRIPIAQRKFDPAFERVTSVFDRNDDGRVTLEEWNKADPDVFGLLDKNEDGQIARSELPTAR